MPPQNPEAWVEGHGTPLTEEQIAIIEAWIVQGAKDNQPELLAEGFERH